MVILTFTLDPLSGFSKLYLFLSGLYTKFMILKSYKIKLTQINNYDLE